MFRAPQTIALSFPSLLLAAIASTSSVSASEIKQLAESSSSAPTFKVGEIKKASDNVTTNNSKVADNKVAGSSLNLDDVINVSGNGLQNPLSAHQPELSSTVVPVTELSNPNINLSSQNSELAAITSVSQLNDVKSTDWAFIALQSLVERYGVIAGYPDSTFRGKQSLTRYEFGAALNTTLDKVNDIISAGLADKVSKEDLATLQKLQEQFAGELAAIRGRVDALDAKTAKLESQQFSTTTKLSGSASFLLAGLSTGSTRSLDGANRSTNLLYAYSVNLNFNTSFSGKDLLSITVAAANSPSTATVVGGGGKNGDLLTNVANFALDGSTSTIANGTFNIGRLYYRFPVSDQATVWLSAFGLQPFDFFPVISPLRNGVSTPNTSYGLFNPVIFRPGFTDIGIGAAFRFSDQWQVHAGYFGASGQANKTSSSPSANAPTSTFSAGSPANFGLFGGSSTIAAQLTFKPSDRFSGSLNFIHKYWSGQINDIDNAGRVSFSGPTGTYLATAPFGIFTPTVADSFGGQFDWRIFPNVGLGGWFSTTAATNLNSGTNATIINAALSLGFFDLFKEGNHGGILVGIIPNVTSSSDPNGKDVNTPWIIETFYTHKFNKNISITPDFYVILNPDLGTPTPIYGFTLRTTFLF